MTNWEMNAAIAQHLGWKDIHVYEDDAGPPIHCGTPPGRNSRSTKIPRYSTDLNAMHEAEASLTDTDAYIRELQIVTVKWKGGKDPGWLVRLARATAEQRAIAFLRAVDKYKED